MCLQPCTPLGKHCIYCVDLNSVSLGSPTSRVRGSVALSTSVKDRSLTDGSTGLDYLMGDDESEVVREEDTSLKPDIRRKMESFLPPSSHESASLLYDPLARSEFMCSGTYP